MSGSLSIRLVIFYRSYTGRYDESQAEHESDNDYRLVIVRRVLNRSCGNQLSVDLCSRRPFFLGEKFGSGDHGRRTAGSVIERELVSSTPAEYGER